MPEREDSPYGNDARGQALEALRDPLIGYFRRRVAEQDDVQDLVQEVFEHLSARGDDGNIENWPAMSSRRRLACSPIVDAAAPSAITTQVELNAERISAVELGTDQIVGGVERSRQGFALLQRVLEGTRTVFVLRRLERLSYGDIATRLGVSVSAVEKHMLRATERFALLVGVR